MAECTLALGVLVSGEGTTFEGLAELAARGELPVRFTTVLADRTGAPALDRARRLGVPTEVVPFRGVPPQLWADQVDTKLRATGTELVLLAGFLSVLPPSLVERWRGRIVNLHPSLLPKYGGPGLYGERVHRAVVAAGETESGATVHVVTEELDRGPILAQVRLRLRPEETAESLRARLHPHEVTVLAETLRRLADGTIPLPVPVPD